MPHISTALPSRDYSYSYFLACLFDVLLFLSVIDRSSPIRLLIYAFPIIILVTVVVTQQQVQLQNRPVLAMILICFAAFPGWLASSGSLSASREILFVLAAPFSFIIRFPIDHRFIKTIAVGICVCAAYYLVSGRTSESEFSLLGSEGAFGESHMAFAAAALTMYFIAVRAPHWAALMLLVTIFSFKRGALLALCLGYGAYLVIGALKTRKSSKLVYTFILTIFFVGLGIALSLTSLLPVLGEFLPVGVSVDQALMGRELLSFILLEVLQSASRFQTIFGFGPGFATEVVGSLTGIPQPHNDYLRIAIDYGLAGFSLLVASWAVLNSAGRFSVALAVFTAVLYLSDNTFIYYYHNFIVAAAVIAYRDQRIGTINYAR